MITEGYVRSIFKGLENGDGASFFEHVDDVDCTMMGVHPLAGAYKSKTEFIAGKFAKLSKVLPNGALSSSPWTLAFGGAAWSALSSYFARW